MLVQQVDRLGDATLRYRFPDSCRVIRSTVGLSKTSLEIERLTRAEAEISQLGST